MHNKMRFVFCCLLLLAMIVISLSVTRSASAASLASSTPSSVSSWSDAHKIVDPQMPQSGTDYTRGYRDGYRLGYYDGYRFCIFAEKQSRNHTIIYVNDYNLGFVDGYDAGYAASVYKYC